MKKLDKWNIDRAPTKGERVVGLIAGIIASLLFGAASILGVWVLFKSEQTLPAEEKLFLLSVLIAFIFSLWLLFRIAFGKGRRPSARASLVAGCFIAAVGIATISFGLTSEAAAIRERSLFVGVAVLAFGVSASSRAWVRFRDS